MIKKNHVAFIALFLLLLLSSHSYSSGINQIVRTQVWNMEQATDTLLQEGLAGSFFGKQGDWFILAGGANFPHGKPWEGGTKTFSNVIFVFSENNNQFQQVTVSDNLPFGVAEGAYVSTSNGLLCMGGQTSDGLSDEVFLLNYNGQDVTVEMYPDLPIAIKNATAAIIGNRVYLIGGQNRDEQSLKQFLMLDLSRLDKGWQSLPDFPVPVSAATMSAQQDGEEISLFVFGGRSMAEGNITNFYSSVFNYKPSQNKWTIKSDIRINETTPIQLSMAVSAPIGATHIALIGGDDGGIFNQVEKAINRNDITTRDSLWINHAGFNDKILLYNTVTDTWFELDNPHKTPVAVSSVVSDGKQIYMSGGEIRPGIRNSEIIKMTATVDSSFGWINYVVLIVYFGGMLFLGFFFMKRNENTDDFFKAGGRIPWWAAGISIFATTLSAITFISIPAKSYATDWRMLLFNLAILMIVPIIIKYFLPFFRRFNFETAYQYLEVRFNRGIRWMASALFVFFMVSRIAIVLFLPSLALNAVTGFSVYFSIIIMGVVTIIYCTSGGMEAVIWGDVIQGFILIAGALVAFAYMVMGVDGGIGTFWDTAITHNKFDWLDFRFDFTQPVFWVVLIGGVANTLITYTSDQSVVQRYMTTKDEKATAKSIWLNGIISVPVSIIFFLLGTGLYVFYISNPANMSITNPNVDSVFPQFIVSEMPVGFAGLLIAAIFAAAMSTLSSNINSVAAVITSDFYKTLWTKITLKRSMSVARWAGIIVGLLGISMALILATWNIASLWDQFNTFLGLLTSGLGALFFLGIFFPRVGATSAFIGLIVGIIILVTVQSNTNVSFLLYGFIGMLSSIIVAYVASFVFPNKKDKKGYTWSSIKK